MKPIMSAPKQTGCLFCPNPTVGLGFVSVEHPIPESMGGELIIRDVCKPCNDYFGREVDCLADVPIVLLLRREAGLTTGKDLSGAYYNERRGTLARARQDQEGRIYPHSPFYQSGDIVEVTAPTQEEAETMAAQV